MAMEEAMKLGLKGIFIYAVLPALVTGVFSFAPKLYDIATEPRASLRFLTTSGPAVRLPSGTRQIVSTSVWNEGRKPLSNVKLALSSELGTTIEASTFEQTTGLSFVATESPKMTSYEVSTLLPGENFSVAAMLTAKVNVKLPLVSARSKETLGIIEQPLANSKSSKVELAGAALASLLASTSVLLMSILVLRKRLQSGPRSSLEAKQSVLFFIAARLKLSDISNEMRITDTRLTYLRMADILLARGLETDGDIRCRAIFALKCILLVKDIANHSVQVIVENLKLLEGEDFSPDEINLLRNKSVEVSREIELRNSINDFISSDSAFLTSPRNS